MNETRRTFFASIILLLLASPVWGAERDAVVKIESKSGNSMGKCSGVCISADGYILTAEHCVANMKGDTWVLFGEKRFKAKVVFDPERNQTDQAGLLKVESPYPLPYARITEKSLRKGDKVHAIGYPDGKFATASGEVVSASNVMRTKNNPPAGPFNPNSRFQTAYQIMVNFNSAGGNSGGPLFNENGEVAGISSTMSHEGAGWIGLPSIRNAMRRIGPLPLRDEKKRALYAFVSTGVG